MNTIKSNNRKYLSLIVGLLVLTSLFSGCKKEKTPEPTLKLSLQTISLKHNGVEQLSVIPEQSVVWSSADTNVAKVSQTGLVTGVRLGSTKVTAKNSTNNLVDECQVLVTPRSGLYLEPFYVYGETKSYIKAKETRVLFSESDEVIFYLGEKSEVKLVGYSFQSNQLTAAIVILKEGNYSAAQTFLEERYIYHGFSSGYDVYRNRDKDVLAVISIHETLGLNVLYSKMARYIS